MAEIPETNLTSSPNINSVLKPPKPRIPLKDLMAVQEEDNTAARKRRVSFANVNKIKEFSAGAESMVVCHTPAYEEPFSVSSDSSYPSGADGLTPAKNNLSTNPQDFHALIYSEQENLAIENIPCIQTVLQNQIPSKYNPYNSASDSINVFQVPAHNSEVQYQGVRPSLTKSRVSSTYIDLEEMDLTDCINIHQGSVRGSTRFSAGMDLTHVVGQSMKSLNYSEGMELTNVVGQSMKTFNCSEGMELTNVVGQSMKTFNCSEGMDLTNVVGQSIKTLTSSEGMDLTKAANGQMSFTQQSYLNYRSSSNFTNCNLDDSGAMEFTNAVNKPRVSTIYSVNNSDSTKNVVYSTNNSRYSVNAMDLTRAAMSCISPARRHSTRYSVSNMDLTEAVNVSDSSALDFTEVISDPKIIAMSTRYSMNDMDLTEGIIKDRLEYSADSETSLDFTKPINNIYQSAVDSGSMCQNSKMELTKMVGDIEASKSTRLSAKLELEETTDNTKSICKSMDETSKLKNNTLSQLADKEISIMTNIEQESISQSNNCDEKETENQRIIDTFPAGQTVDTVQNVSNSSIVSVYSSEGHQRTLQQTFNISLDCSTSSTICMEETKTNKSTTTCDKNNEEKIISKSSEVSSSNMDLTQIKPSDTKSSKRDILSAENQMQCQNLSEITVPEPAVTGDTKSSKRDMLSAENQMQCQNLSEVTVPEPAVTDFKESVEFKQHSVDIECKDTARIQDSIVEKVECDELNMSVLSLDDEVEVLENKTLEQNECSSNNDKDFEMKSGPTVHEQPTIEQTEYDNMDISITTDTHNKDEDENMDMSLAYSSIAIDKVESDELNCNSSPSTNALGDLNNDCKKNQVFKMSNESNNDIVISPKFENTNQQTKAKLTIDECKDKKSRDEIMHGNSVSKDVAPITLHISSDSLFGTPTNTTLNSKNITMTRGTRKSQFFSVQHGARDNNTLINNDAEQTSELDVLPLIQPKALNNNTFIYSETESTFKAADSPVKKTNKGGKRSFEMALESENDTEESPVKQICLPPVSFHEHDLLINQTAPSIFMDSLTAPNDTVPWIQSEMTFTTSKGNITLDNRSCVKLKVVEKTLPENIVPKDPTISFVERNETRDYPEGFSLRIDISTDHDVSTAPMSVDQTRSMNLEIKESCSKVCQRQIQIKDHSKISAHYQEPIHTTLNYTTEHDNTSIAMDETNSQINSLSLSSIPAHKTEDSRDSKDLNYKTRAKTNIDKEQIHNLDNVLISVTNISRTSSEQLRRTFGLYGKNVKIIDLGEGHFTCHLIPRWVELQVSADKNGNIVDSAYNILCQERELSVGEYIVGQLNSSSQLPEKVTGLQPHLQHPTVVFLTRLARNLSLICKYHNGKINGNVLTLDVISCRNRFWACVNVNIKFPQFLSSEDITVAQKRIGELKISQVRQIFGCIEKGPDQLMNFASELTKLQY